MAKDSPDRIDEGLNRVIGIASTAVCPPAFLNIKDAFGFSAAQDLGMFCYQCEQTMGGIGCTKIGMCGKKPEVAALHDLLIHALKGLAAVAVAARQKGIEDVEVNRFVPMATFSTLTNVDFDPKRFVALIRKTVELRERIRSKAALSIDTIPNSGPAVTIRSSLKKCRKIAWSSHLPAASFASLIRI
jgi:hypothetical protein